MIPQPVKSHQCHPLIQQCFSDSSGRHCILLQHMRSPHLLPEESILLSLGGEGLQCLCNRDREIKTVYFLKWRFKDSLVTLLNICQFSHATFESPAPHCAWRALKTEIWHQENPKASHHFSPGPRSRLGKYFG